MTRDADTTSGALAGWLRRSGQLARLGCHFMADEQSQLFSSLSVLSARHSVSAKAGNTPKGPVPRSRIATQPTLHLNLLAYTFRCPSNDASTPKWLGSWLAPSFSGFGATTWSFLEQIVDLMLPKRFPDSLQSRKIPNSLSLCKHQTDCRRSLQSGHLKVGGQGQLLAERQICQHRVHQLGPEWLSQRVYKTRFAVSLWLGTAHRWWHTGSPA